MELCTRHRTAPSVAAGSFGTQLLVVIFLSRVSRMRATWWMCVLCVLISVRRESARAESCWLRLLSVFMFWSCVGRCRVVVLSVFHELPCQCVYVSLCVRVLLFLVLQRTRKMSNMHRRDAAGLNTVLLGYLDTHNYFHWINIRKTVQIWHRGSNNMIINGA